MPLIRQKSVRTTQPQGVARIDKSNPFGARVKTVLLPSQALATDFNGGKWSVASGAYNAVAGKNGGVSITHPVRLVSTSTIDLSKDFTLTVCVTTGTSAAGFEVLMAGGGMWFGLRSGQFYISNSSYDTSTGVNALQNTSYIFTITQSYSTQKIYLGSTLVKSTNYTYGSGSITLMGYAGGGYSFTGSISNFQAYAYALSDAEVFALSSNINQIYAPPQRTIAFDVAADGATAYTLTASAGMYVLSGKSASFTYARKLNASSGTYTLSGKAATLKRGYSLSATVGSYALSGKAATLIYSSGAVTHNYVLTAEAGSYAVTGNAAAFNYARKLTASAGSYTLSGKSATFKRGYALSAGSGSYALTGNNATLRRGYAITASTGSYSLSGKAATLTYAAGNTTQNRTMVCATGAYSLSGNTAAFNYSRKLIASAGAYALAGQSSLLQYGRAIQCAAGSYALSGKAATFKRGYSMLASTGTYSLTGNAATLTYTNSQSYSISADRALLIYQLALLHGLDSARPLSVSNTARSAGSLTQTVAGTNTVTITRTSAPVFSGNLDAWIDDLAAVHGLTVPLVVTSNSRTAGALSQTISTVGATTTVTRQ